MWAQNNPVLLNAMAFQWFWLEPNLYGHEIKCSVVLPTLEEEKKSKIWFLHFYSVEKS